MADQLDPLTSEVIRAKTAIRRAAVTSALRLWNDIGGISDTDVAEFVTRLGPSHRTSLVSVAQLVDAYIDAFLTAHGETLAGTSRRDMDTLLAEVRAGTTIDERLERPFVEARTAIARGALFGQAMGQAAARLGNIVGTDVQQTYRLRTAEILPQTSIPGYRRVLVGPENCILCITASTVRYRSDKLMPIHPGCDCAVAPLDPGMAVTRAGTIASEIPRLDQARDIIRQQTGVPYLDREGMANLKVRLDGLDAVEEIPHGELGPVLAIARHRNDTLPWNRRTRREFGMDGTRTR